MVRIHHSHLTDANDGSLMGAWLKKRKSSGPTQDPSLGQYSNLPVIQPFWHRLSLFGLASCYKRFNPEQSNISPLLCAANWP